MTPFGIRLVAYWAYWFPNEGDFVHLCTHEPATHWHESIENMFRLPLSDPVSVNKPRSTSINHVKSLMNPND